MPISGLLITVDSDAQAADAAVAEVATRPHFTLGDRQGQRLPAVLDTPDAEVDRRCWRWVNNLPGVAKVDVVFIHFDDALPADRPLLTPALPENSR